MKTIKDIRKDTKRAREYFENKLAYSLGPVELENMMTTYPDEVRIIDVRKPEDFEKGHIPASINMQPFEIDETKECSWSSDKINIMVCYNQQCHLGASCAYKLAKKGCPVMELEGGFRAWEKFGMKVEV